MSTPNIDQFLTPLSIPSPAECRERLQKEIYTLLGGNLIDLELTPDDIQLAIDIAIDRYRMRSAHAQEESFLFMTIQPDIQEYTLPKEISQVYKIYRRGTGTTLPGSFMDPFSAAFINVVYGLPWIGGRGVGGGGVAGDLVVYDLAHQYFELLGRLFGREVLFHYNESTKKLFLHRFFRHPETVLLHVYMYKPENILLTQPSSRTWLRDYALARAKYILGEARQYMNGAPGPGGPISLNGSELKEEARAEMERLENELKNFSDADSNPRGLPIIIG